MSSRSRRLTVYITIGDYVEIRALTLDERLTAAAIIMRDAIEKHDAEVASSPPRIYPAESKRTADMS